MMNAVAGRRAAALSAVVALILLASEARAQAGGAADATATQAPPPVPAGPRGQNGSQLPPLQPGELDPSAPLDSWPGMDVEWPDMNQPDQPPPAAGDEAGADANVPAQGANANANAPAEGAAPGVSPAAAQAPAAAAQVSDAAAAHRYDWRIVGLDDVATDGLEDQFKSLSTLEEYKGDPANAAQIDRRARSDAELLSQILRSRGYYDASVFTRVSSAADGRVTVTLRARPGPVYRYAEVRLPGLEEAKDSDEPPLRAAFNVNPEQPVDAGKVEAALAALRAELGRRGYAFAEVGEPDVLVDHETRTAVLTLSVHPDGVRRFGRVVIEGTPVFSAAHVENIARFEQGEQYQASRIDDLRQALIQTGLVSSVNIRTVAEPNSDLVDLHVRMEAAPARTIAGEAGYGTGEGFRLEASWQHRNLIAPEGAVTLRGVLGTREQTLSAILRQSNWHVRDQVLNAQIAASHLDRPGFNARTFTLTGGIERQSNIIWQKKWTWSVGAELLASDERDVDIATGTIRNRTFFIAALPLSLGYDGTDDLLDPTRGFRLSTHISPEVSLQSGTFTYVRAQFDGSIYQPLTDRVVLAARTRLGTIVGANRDQIAPSRRFYAGGGGSVRGYGYQAIGPRDPVFDDPIGGRSLAEFSIEARIRFGNFGIVPFLDAGNISTSGLPRFNDLQFGAGLGARYYSSFGPIRIDVGTPLNRQPGDPRIAVYVSLGQAF